MKQPLLSSVDLWARHERRCLEVLTVALARLSVPDPDETEDELNRRLYRCIAEAARAIERRDGIELPVVVPEGRNPPLASDSQRAAREFKRPDFYWAYHDHDGEEPARQLVVECKRLTRAASRWIYTEQYVTAGITRFVTIDHGYGKEAPSGVMVGYLQSMDAETALAEVNDHLQTANLPHALAAHGHTGQLTQLEHLLQRGFPHSPFRLGNDGADSSERRNTTLIWR
jgi:hypothetical protein